MRSTAGHGALNWEGLENSGQEPWRDIPYLDPYNMARAPVGGAVYCIAEVRFLFWHAFPAMHVFTACVVMRTVQ